jgi:hypothetical protein
MFKNTASQIVGAQLLNKTDGTAVTTGTTNVFVTGDGGTQAAAGNTTATHEGKGFWTYVTTAGDTNYDHVAFTFENTNAANVTIQAYTQAKFVSDVLNASAKTMMYGTVNSTGNTTTQITLSTINTMGGGNSVGANALAGRRAFFTSDTATLALRGCGARITANTATSGTTVLTLHTNDILPATPATGDVIAIA